MRAFLPLLVLSLAACGDSSTPPDEKTDEQAPMEEPSDKVKTPPAPKPPSEIPAPDDVAAPPADADKTESGLAYKVLSKGGGDDAKPVATSQVKVHYTGWTTDGKMFDSSRSRGEPAVFPLNRVIAGWTEGLQLMSPGDSFRLWIPEDLAYQGRAGAPAGMLVFDVELLEIVK